MRALVESMSEVASFLQASDEGLIQRATAVDFSLKLTQLELCAKYPVSGSVAVE